MSTSRTNLDWKLISYLTSVGFVFITAVTFVVA